MKTIVPWDDFGFRDPLQKSEGVRFAAATSMLGCAVSERRQRILFCCELALWAFAAYATFRYVGFVLAPDACLDQGGSFDYDTWSCGSGAHAFRDVPFHRMPGFLLMAFATTAALVTRIVRKQAKPSASVVH